MGNENSTLLLKGGMVYDGTINPPFRADIRIEGGLIAGVGETLEEEKKEKNPAQVIDISGLSVAPGFIDTHGHSEFSLLREIPEGKIFQGITTEINGNCGLSGAPLMGEALKQREKELEGLGIIKWSGMNEYLRILEDRGLYINFATLAGHGSIRASVIGYSNRRPDEREKGMMKDLLGESLRAGAIGLSTGLIYPPGIYSDTEELTELSSYGGKAAPGGFIYASHMRSEGRRLIEALEELLSIGKNAGIRVHVSHIKTAGRDNWHKAGEAVSLMDEARKNGIRLTCDRYPYAAASTDLDSVLPQWVFEGGNRAELERLKISETRERIASELAALNPDWGSVVVSAVSLDVNKWMEGMDISSIAKRTGAKPVDALIGLLIEEELRVDAIFHSMSEDNLRKFLSLPYCMVGTDSSARSLSGPGKPHPRGFGSFPRYLSRYAGDLSSGIHKTTMLPAETFGLKGRGQLRKGFCADIVVFDPAELTDRATYNEPYAGCGGIKYVFVNGVPVVSNGSLTGERPGRVLKHGV